VPQFNINVGDTPAEILELVCRHAALLFYEGADGNLILPGRQGQGGVRLRRGPERPGARSLVKSMAAAIPSTSARCSR
jgi:prophage tail gpP-like protein